MKKLTAAALILALALPVISGCTAEMTGGDTPSEQAFEETVGAETVNVRPQDDYYYYINRDRLDNAVFEYGENAAGTAFDQHLVQDQVEDLISEIAAGDGYQRGTEEDLIDRAYELYMQYDFETSEVPADLMSLIAQIEAAGSVAQLLDIDAVLVRDYGMDGLFFASVGINYLTPGENVLTFHQLPGVLNAGFTDIRDGNEALDALKTRAQLIMTSLGYDVAEAERCGTELAYMAFDLYGVTDMEFMDAAMPFPYVREIPADELYGMFTNADLQSYLQTIGYDTGRMDHFCIEDGMQLQGLNGALNEEDLDALKTWEICSLVESFIRYFAPCCGQLAGLDTVSFDPKQEQAVNEVSRIFYRETDPVYVETYYQQETDTMLRSMCDDIREGYRDLITNADWLTQDTRDGLLRKLDNIVYVTGTDLRRHDPSDFAQVEGSDYFEYSMNYMRLITSRQIESLYEPLSRYYINMAMQEFNACYDPSLNSITITAAITNAPFFDADAPYYTNLGGLGMVIAHEMGHAFDSNCILFDEDGRYDPSWIPAEDTLALQERNEQAAAYFEDNFTVFGVYHVDGEQTLGENYADLGGMECITSLAESQDDLRLLFENYATIWCEKKVDSALLYQLANDEHSPEIIRVNAILSTTAPFYEVYGVQEGDGMYIAPEDRISRWY